jgi:hypothetical protein
MLKLRHLTEIVVAGSIAMAAGISTVVAQSAPPVPEKPQEGQAGPGGEGGFLPHSGAQPRTITVVKGWNTIHAYSCLLTRSGTTFTIKLNALASEGVYITSTYPEVHAMMVAQCALGNWISFYVTKKTTSNFTWSSLQAWSYK